MKRNRSKRKFRRDFTLIELLMVISIIAILTCVLLPALKKTRDTAKKIQCAGNLKQVGACWFSYIDDNGGMLPPASWDGNTWFHKLYPQILETLPVVAYPATPKKTIFMCSVNNPRTSGNTTQWTYSVSYGMNDYCGMKFSGGNGYHSQKIENMVSPSQSYIIMDSFPLDDNGKGIKSCSIWIEKGNTDGNCPGFIHGAPNPSGIANILFGDGHVGNSKYSEINSEYYKVYRSFKTF